MAGLYSKRNLGEVQLNLVDAVQKLYSTGIQRDITLFAFSNSLFSDINSATYIEDFESGQKTVIPNQIYGLKNEPFFDGQQTVLRTKFITNAFTFSSENKVYFDVISTDSFSFDARTSSDPGAKVLVSRNGSLVNVGVKGSGSQYEIKDEDGVVVETQDVVDVRVRGKVSGANNAVVRVTVTADGKISRTILPVVISGGSGYLEGEVLDIIPQCGVDRYGVVETPLNTKCAEYSSAANRLYRDAYNENNETLGFDASLFSVPYTYTTKFSGSDGFFLYDETNQEWVYLGAYYDELRYISDSGEPKLVIKRADVLTSQNLLSLYKLNTRSNFFDYDETYSVSEDISSNIRALSDSVEKIKDQFKYLFQNSRRSRLADDPQNELGTEYNVFNGVNIDSSFRIVVRDPDSVLDRPELDFFTIRDTLNSAGAVELSLGEETLHVPGLWINLGDKYQRVFSSDDKPFFSSNKKNLISPLLTKLNTGTDFSVDGAYTERAEFGDNKYSISTSYLKTGASSVLGFNTTISVLTQNLSSSIEGGGFVYHSPFTSPVINTSQNIVGLPLFKYRDLGTEYVPYILAYDAT